MIHQQSDPRPKIPRARTPSSPTSPIELPFCGTQRVTRKIGSGSMGYHKDTSGEALSMSAFEWNPIGVGMEHRLPSFASASLTPFPHFFLSRRSITRCALVAIFHQHSIMLSLFFALLFLVVLARFLDLVSDRVIRIYRRRDCNQLSRSWRSLADLRGYVIERLALVGENWEPRVLRCVDPLNMNRSEEVIFF